ncbi:MAG TPA: hypothetical protein VD978_11530 [Azospirillum sp.]|nr:hypothetical protein [Azospirillum sp.]
MTEAPTRRTVLILAAAALISSAMPTAAEGGAHRVAIQVDSNDPAVMNMALNNLSNVAEYYTGVGEEVQIELVTFGPGLHMMREDNSPVKERLKKLKKSLPNLTLTACENTRNGMKRVEGREIPLMAEVVSVPSGVVRLMQLQEQGWSYIRP